MANKVTNEDIITINERYLVCKNKAQVARETGFSSSTITKYIIPNYTAQAEIVTIEFNKEILEVDVDIFLNSDNWGNLTVLTEQEKSDVKELQKEISI